MARRNVVCLNASQTLGEVRQWIASRAQGSTHQGFPVLDEHGKLSGVVTRRDLLGNTVPDEQALRSLIRRSPLTISSDSTLRMAADQMVNFEVGRLPVVDADSPGKIVGILTRSDLLDAHRRRLRETRRAERSFSFKRPGNGQVATATAEES